MFSNPDTIQGHGVNAVTRRSINKGYAQRGINDLTSLTPLEESKNIFALSFVFTNRLGVSVALGNLTHCAKEIMPVEFFHEHSLHFSIYTLWLAKRWYFWRFKNIIECWFCADCTIADIQKASDKVLAASPNSTTF
jgi:hypothetical protein